MVVIYVFYCFIRDCKCYVIQMFINILDGGIGIVFLGYICLGMNKIIVIQVEIVCIVYVCCIFRCYCQIVVFKVGVKYCVGWVN